MKISAVKDILFYMILISIFGGVSFLTFNVVSDYGSNSTAFFLGVAVSAISMILVLFISAISKGKIDSVAIYEYGFIVMVAFMAVVIILAGYKYVGGLFN